MPPTCSTPCRASRRTCTDGCPGAAVAGDHRSAFSWGGPLALCGAIVAQDAGNADWRDTRLAAADLLRAALDEANEAPAAAPGRLPAVERGLVWTILARLAEDPDPSTGSVSDAALSHGAVRPSALDAVVAYAGWAARDTSGNANGRADDLELRLEARGFARTPEAGAVLATHAEWARDPSHAVRAAYGRRLGSLAAFDPAWTVAHLADMLPDALEQADAADTVTRMYLTSTRATAAALPALEPLYRRAMADLSRSADSVNGDDADDQGPASLAGQAREGLAAHLMPLYLDGAH